MPEKQTALSRELTALKAEKGWGVGRLAKALNLPHASTKKYLNGAIPQSEQRLRHIFTGIVSLRGLKEPGGEENESVEPELTPDEEAALEPPESAEAVGPAPPAVRQMRESDRNWKV